MNIYPAITVSVNVDTVVYWVSLPAEYDAI